MGFNSIGLIGGGVKSKLRGLGTLFLVAVLLMGLVTGCPAPTDDEPVVETPVFPLTVTDQAGRIVTLEAEPQKIISLAPSNTEIVFALGLGDRLVGVTEFCDYPAAAEDKPKIGGFNTIDIESVVAIQPDLILATSIHMPEVVQQLESPEVALTVLVLDPRSLEEVLGAITLIGEVTGKEDEASQLVNDMRSRIEAVTDITANLSEAERLRVFYVMWHEPLMTVGADTLILKLIGMAGGVSIVQDMVDDYPMISLEAVIQANPQVIIAGSGMGEGADLPFQFALNDDRLDGVDARINNRIYEVITDIVGRPGPRIVEGLEQLARMIHPEIFGEID